MSDDSQTHDTEFDPLIAMVLAETTAPATPSPEVKRRLMETLAGSSVPKGFAIRLGADDDWAPHPVPGIRMKVLALNRASGYATLLLDVAPGTRFPAHHHAEAEECLVLAGSLHTCGRRLEAGDFIHANAGTDHGELWTDEGCRVLLVVEPEDYMTAPPSGAAPGTR